MIEYTLLNILISELKIYCGPDKFYGWSKFGQYDEVNNRAPLNGEIPIGSPLRYQRVAHGQLPCFYLALLRKQGTWDGDTGSIHCFTSRKSYLRATYVWAQIGIFIKHTT